MNNRDFRDDDGVASTSFCFTMIGWTPRPTRIATSQGSRSSTSRCGASSTPCCPRPTGGPPETRPPKRSACLVRWPPSISTSWPTPAWSRSASSARAAAPGRAPGGRRSCTDPSQDELSASIPERHYDLAGSLLASAIADATATGAPVGDCLTSNAEAAGRRIGLEAGRPPANSNAPRTPTTPTTAARSWSTCSPRTGTARRRSRRRRDRAHQLPVPSSRRGTPDARLRHEPRLHRWPPRRASAMPTG